jgi:hypothetical protein
MPPAAGSRRAGSSPRGALELWPHLMPSGSQGRSNSLEKPGGVCLEPQSDEAFHRGDLADRADGDELRRFRPPSALESGLDCAEQHFQRGIETVPASDVECEAAALGPPAAGLELPARARHFPLVAFTRRPCRGSR